MEFQDYLQNAEKMAKKKDSHSFAKNIAFAEQLISSEEEKRQLYKAEILGLRKVNDYESALQLAIKAEEVYDGGQFEQDILRNKAIVLSRMGRFNGAINIFNELIFSDTKEQRLKAYINLVWIYVTQYNGTEEEEYLKKAEENSNKVLDLLETCEIDDRLHKVFLTNLGCVYYNQGEHDKALEVFREQKEKFTEKKDYPIIYNNLASIMIEKVCKEMALEYLDIALAEAENLDSPKDIAENYMMRAELFMTDENYNKAKESYIKAHDNFVRANDLNKACLVYKKIQNVDFTVSNNSIDILRSQLPNS